MTTINLNFGDLETSIGQALKDYLAGFKADLKKDLEGEATRITQRGIELLARAAAGDQVAKEGLEDLYAQAISVGALAAMREFDRGLATIQLIVSSTLKVLIGAAVGVL